MPPAIFNNIKPNPTPIHLVKILINTTIVNASERSIPCKVKNPAKLPSVTPIPIGRNDTTPKSIELVYVAIIVVNSKIFTSNASKTKYTTIASVIQNNADKIVEITKNFPLSEFFSISCDVSKDNSYLEINLNFATLRKIL